MPPRRIRHLLHPATRLATVLLIAGAVATPLADGAERTVGFSTAVAPSAGEAAFAMPAEQLGVSAGSIAFQRNTEEDKALDAAQEGEGFRTKAGEQRAISNKAQARIAAIEESLAIAQGDNDRLKAEIEARLVERYEAGETSDLTFLLSGSNLSGLIDRSKILRDQQSSDAQLAEDYAYSVARLEQLRQVLDDVSQVADERADNFTARAERADATLVAARTARSYEERTPTETEAPVDPATGKTKAPGTWFVMGGAFEAQLFLPTTGSSYDGGETRVPAQRATAEQIGAVLADPRIELDSSGIRDVQSGQIDGRILQAMSLAAAQFGHIKITALKSDHNSYTTGGNVSEHSFGCAMDIGTIGSTYIEPSAQVQGGEVYRAVLFFAGLGKLNPLLAPHQVISLFDVGGPTFSAADHGDHIHVGYHC